MIDNLKINVVIPFYSNADWLDEALNKCNWANGDSR